jgi:hypothetical protein
MCLLTNSLSKNKPLEQLSRLICEINPVKPEPIKNFGYFPDALILSYSQASH